MDVGNKGHYIKDSKNKYDVKRPGVTLDHTGGTVSSVWLRNGKKDAYIGFFGAHKTQQDLGEVLGSSTFSSGALHNFPRRAADIDDMMSWFSEFPKLAGKLNTLFDLSSLNPKLIFPDGSYKHGDDPSSGQWHFEYTYDPNSNNFRYSGDLKFSETLPSTLENEVFLKLLRGALAILPTMDLAPAIDM